MRSITEFSREFLMVSVSLLILITGCSDTDEEQEAQEKVIVDTAIPHEPQAVAHFSIPDAYVADEGLALKSETRLDEVSDLGQDLVYGPLPRVPRCPPPPLHRPSHLIPLPKLRDHVSFKCADNASEITAVMSVSLVRLSGADAETIDTALTHVHCQEVTVVINRLQVDELYRIEAELVRPDGELYYRGKSEEFGVVPGETNQIELVMKRVDYESEGGVEVLVSFEDSDDISEIIPSPCDMSTIAETGYCAKRRANEFIFSQIGLPELLRQLIAHRQMSASQSADDIESTSEPSEN